MLIMWKFDRELAVVFRLRRLIGIVRAAENETFIFTRSSFHMTNRADGRPRTNHRWASKELLPMTTHAGIVIGRVSDIGKVTLGIPFSGNLVTVIAFQTLVFV